MKANIIRKGGVGVIISGLYTIWSILYPTSISGWQMPDISSLDILFGVIVCPSSISRQQTSRYPLREKNILLLYWLYSFR